MDIKIEGECFEWMEIDAFRGCRFGDGKSMIFPPRIIPLNASSDIIL